MHAITVVDEHSQTFLLMWFRFLLCYIFCYSELFVAKNSSLFETPIQTSFHKQGIAVE